jgi:hypothetical protein
MIVFWYSQDANVTPPVSLASFAGAGVAGANPMRTAFTSWKLAKGLYIIPWSWPTAPCWGWAKGYELLHWEVGLTMAPRCWAWWPLPRPSSAISSAGPPGRKRASWPLSLRPLPFTSNHFLFRLFAVSVFEKPLFLIHPNHRKGEPHGRIVWRCFNF